MPQHFASPSIRKPLASSFGSLCLGLSASFAVHSPCAAVGVNQESVAVPAARPVAWQLGASAAAPVFEWNGAAGQRPRGSLRFQFDSATRVLRQAGMDAHDCKTVLRSHRASAWAGDDSSRLGVTVALNCRFF
jgi:hypothetical protein